MKALHGAFDRIAVLVEAAVADALPARHLATQPGHGQAAFPAQFLGLAQRRDDRVAQYRTRHHRRVRVARVRLPAAEDHHLQIHPDLGCSQPGAIGRGHGVEQVGDEQMQRIRVEFTDRLRHAQQPRIPHA